jgi:redox-sensitive bicupin YhaK (pirin superfamily)
MGGSSVLRPGEVQRMTAGTGVLHSEFNPSTTDPVHFLQIWILPEKRGLKPGYEQKRFPDEERRNVLRTVASPDRRDGSLSIHQDVVLHATLLEKGRRLAQELAPGRHAWVQVARGAVELNGRSMKAGDGAALSGERSLELVASMDSEVLLFDLA